MRFWAMLKQRHLQPFERHAVRMGEWTFEIKYCLEVFSSKTLLVRDFCKTFCKMLYCTANPLIHEKSSWIYLSYTPLCRCQEHCFSPVALVTASTHVSNYSIQAYTSSTLRWSQMYSMLINLLTIGLRCCIHRLKCTPKSKFSSPIGNAVELLLIHYQDSSLERGSIQYCQKGVQVLVNYLSLPTKYWLVKPR